MKGVTPLAGGTPLPVEDYAYDEEGNRTASHLSAFYASNAHNQLLEDDGFTYAYDAKGNRISKTSKADGSVETYTYDSQNRLVGYAAGGTVASYAYDALDRRIVKVVNSDLTAFIYDTLEPRFPNVLNANLEFQNGSLEKRWLFSDRVDEPIEFEQYQSLSAPGAGVLHQVFHDHLGSIVGVISTQSGALELLSEYESFGIPDDVGSPNRFAFTGRENDKETKLLYYRSRHFDPQTGQFIQMDPVELLSGTQNLYSYVDNNPLNFTDPSGLTQARPGTARSMPSAITSDFIQLG